MYWEVLCLLGGRGEGGEGHCNYRNKYWKFKINLLRVQAGARLTSSLFKSGEDELKLGITVLQIHLVVREPGIFGFEVRYRDRSATLPPLGQLFHLFVLYRDSKILCLQTCKIWRLQSEHFRESYWCGAFCYTVESYWTALWCVAAKRCCYRSCCRRNHAPKTKTLLTWKLSWPQRNGLSTYLFS